MHHWYIQCVCTWIASCSAASSLKSDEPAKMGLINADRSISRPAYSRRQRLLVQHPPLCTTWECWYVTVYNSLRPFSGVKLRFLSPACWSSVPITLISSLANQLIISRIISVTISHTFRRPLQLKTHFFLHVFVVFFSLDLCRYTDLKESSPSGIFCSLCRCITVMSGGLRYPGWLLDALQYSPTYLFSSSPSQLVRAR